MVEEVKSGDPSDMWLNFNFTANLFRVHDLKIQLTEVQRYQLLQIFLINKSMLQPCTILGQIRTPSFWINENFEFP
ncbi:hypothetical protein LXL04_016891 [Taraxacum kok-saghyz]